MYFPSGWLTFAQLDFNLQQRNEYWMAAGVRERWEECSSAWSQSAFCCSSLDWCDAREVVAVCMCVHACVWLARQYRCKHGCAALEVFSSSLKHNQSYIWRPGEESVERGYMVIGDGKAYRYQPQENRNKNWWAQLRKASEILYWWLNVVVFFKSFSVRCLDMTWWRPTC